jgi:mono/diheme cytochrome c family protein
VKALQFTTIIICSALFALSAAAQNSPSEMSLTQNPVYKKDCAKCHGKTAGGRMMGGPGLVSDKVAAMSTDDIHNMIANGKGHMPKFAAKLSSDEIDTLTQEVKALNTK